MNVENTKMTYIVKEMRYMSRFININMNVENAKMTYVVKRREYVTNRLLTLPVYLLLLINIHRSCSSGWKI